MWRASSWRWPDGECEHGDASRPDGSWFVTRDLGESHRDARASIVEADCPLPEPEARPVVAGRVVK